MTSVVVELRGPREGQRTVVLDTRTPKWLGRGSDCALTLCSDRVSRRHASLETRAGTLVLRDASVNGTWVDDTLVHDTERALGHGAHLRVGPYELRVKTLDPASAPEPGATQRPDENLDRDAQLRKQIHAHVLSRMDLATLDHRTMDPAALKAPVETALEAICTELGAAADDGDARRALIDELRDEVLGLGPLESLLRDPQVSEIMVVNASTIFAEIHGRLVLTPLRFTDDACVRAIIERIVTPLGRRIDESSPMVDARLPDGSRVNAVIPPLATRGPCITIRKFGGAPLHVSDLIARGSLDERVARFLSRAVRARRNMVVSGGTGSGKTTLLNVLCAEISEHERIVTIEDAAELRLRQAHVVSLEARTENLEGRGAVTIRDLLRNALRMRPDRILVGECRGGEALDMLQAMNTGHDGSMTTTHANSPREAVARIETLCLMADVELPLRAIRAQLAASVHLVVQQTRTADGFRGVTHVSEVVGVDRDGEVVIEDVFRRAPRGERRAPTFELTGYVPRCLRTFMEHGLVEDGEYL